MSGPTIKTRIDQVLIYPGETLSVVLSPRGLRSAEGQVTAELRVTGSGTPEIFLNGTSEVRSFADWYSDSSIPQDEARRCCDPIVLASPRPSWLRRLWRRVAGGPAS